MPDVPSKRVNDCCVFRSARVLDGVDSGEYMDVNWQLLRAAVMIEDDDHALALGLAAVAILMLWRWSRRVKLGLLPD